MTWDGVPENPERDGWHWVRSAEGPVPALWARPMWRHCRDFWDQRSPEWMRVMGWSYLGPCLTPAEIAAREQAAREKALREAAAEVDCGCAARSDVLKWLAESGERRARSMCAGHGDACCALQAAAILALIKEPSR